MPNPILVRILSSSSSQPCAVNLDPVPESLNDACIQLPAGVYTTLRTFNRQQVLNLDDHFQRLEQSAGLIGHHLELDRQSLRQALREIVAESPSADDYRIRLVVDLENKPGTVYILRANLKLPDADNYLHGTLLITSDLQRIQPAAKSTVFIAASDQLVLPAGVNEALLLDNQRRILEGMSSNFFAVLNGVLRTAQTGILPGITRQMVLEEASSAGLPIQLEALPTAELRTIQEAFITSSSRGVLPVRQIDTQEIGSGSPGTVTRQLMQLYQARIERQLEAI
jgi:branched-chain amino acid aminotransferase